MLLPRPILAIDTATGPCSVAVYKDGRVCAYLEEMQSSKQSIRLVPMIEEALAESKIGYADLSAVACTVGPGSFTGLRVGLAAARAIGLTANIPTLGYTTLEVLAFAARRESDAPAALAILNAGKGECYYQLFSLIPELAAMYEPEVADAKQAVIPQGCIIAGNMPVEGFLSSRTTFPRADMLAQLAAEKPLAPRALTPYYIRLPDAKPMAIVSPLPHAGEGYEA